MKKNELNDLLDKYLNGTATEDEKELMDHFFNSFEEPTVKQFFLDAKKGQLREEMWAVIQSDFHKYRDGNVPIYPMQGMKGIRTGASRKIYKAVVAAVATVVLVLVSLFLVVNNTPHENVAQAAVVKVTLKGEKKTIHLADGTVIKLNSNSRLTFPERFSGNERRVVLQGEAWFEVAKDSARPFMVETQYLTTRVFGTRFNVRSFLKEEVAVTLVEGKVQVAQGPREIMLAPNDQVVYRPATNLLTKEVVDPALSIAWKDGVLHVEESRLLEIIPVLENWYGVSFQYNDEDIRNCVVSSATWDNQSLGQVLSSISYMMNNRVKFVIKGKHVVIQSP